MYFDKAENEAFILYSFALFMGISCLNEFEQDSAKFFWLSQDNKEMEPEALRNQVTQESDLQWCDHFCCELDVQLCFPFPSLLVFSLKIQNFHLVAVLRLLPGKKCIARNYNTYFLWR